MLFFMRFLLVRFSDDALFCKFIQNACFDDVFFVDVILLM